MVDVDRRRCLAVVGAAGASALAGCISGSTDDRGEFVADRAAAKRGEPCDGEELVDESFRLRGRAVSVVHGSAAKEWRVEMESGEELEVTMFKRDPRGNYRIPRIAIIDPNGQALVEKGRPSSNDHAVTAETDGTYTVRVRNRYLTEDHGYMVAITWYGTTGCTE
jgi:hypothetical protein